jgi:hypothetical protein
VNDTVRPRPALDIHEESNTQEHLILPLAITTIHQVDLHLFARDV